jgi:hypothetical protein
MALANVELTNTFDEWRTRTNQLVVQGEQTLVNVSTLFTRVDNGNLWANSVGTRSNTYADSVGGRANTYADSVGARANTYANSYANSVGNRANTYADSVGGRANTYADLVGVRANNYTISYADSTGTKSNNFASSAVATEAGLARNANNLTSGIVPVARLDGSYTGIKGVGTITSGIWNGTDIALADGGTGATLTACSGAVVYSTSSAFSFTAVGTSGQLLQSGATGAPSWVSPSSLTVSRSSTTGTADNSNLLGGYSLQFGNTVGVAGRDSAGDITGRLFRSEFQNESSMSGAIAFRNAAGAGADNYTRYCSSPAAVRSWLTVGDELIAAIAMNTGATSIGFSADLNPYKKIWVSAIGVSHNGAGTTARTFRIYSPSTGGSQTCSQSYTGAGSWYGFVIIDMFSGVGIYGDDGTTVAANPFSIYKSSGGFSFNTSGNNGFDGGSIYIWGERG